MRKVLPVLLIASVAVAAPVLKLKPTMAEIYGQPTTDEKACVVEMNRNGTLKLTLPTTAPAEHPANVLYKGPQVAKDVDGDFTLTTRMMLELPKTASTAHRGFPPGAAAGLSVCADRGPRGDKLGTAVTIGKNDVSRDRWNFFEYHYSGRQGCGSSAEKAQDVKDDAPIYLRVTRKGDEVTTVYSADGKIWHETGKQPITGSVKVGPVVIGCLEKEFAVSFDEYELKVEEKK